MTKEEKEALEALQSIAASLERIADHLCKEPIKWHYHQKIGPLPSQFEMNK